VLRLPAAGKKAQGKFGRYLKVLLRSVQAFRIFAARQIH
jgi:hypothetical protein